MADRTVKVSLVANAAQFNREFAEAAKKTRDLGSEAEKLAQKGEAFTTLGAAAVTFGAATLAAVGLATKAAMDWESAWTGVTKTVDGSATEMAALEGELRGLAKTLPATHQEIAAVAEAAGQLGVKREDVAAFTETMVALGETTNLTADEAATSIAQLMNVMGTAPEEVDNLGASLVALGNDGASTERDIIQMAQRIAGAGKIIGLTEGEVMGFANALASAGIDVEAGGSAISRIMTDIAKSVSAGGEDLEGFASVAGMSAEDFAVAFKDAPAEAIATFIEGLGGINAAGGDVFTTLSDLGQSDIRVSQALLGMANSGDLLRNSLELGNEAWKDNTALAEEAEKRYATTEAQLQIMVNKISDAAIAFGAVFLPALGAVADALGQFADFLGGMPVPLQELTAILGLGAGAVALVGGAALLAVPKIAAFKVAMETLGVSGGRATGVLRGVASFLTGPWGLAMAVGVTAFAVWNDANNKFQAGAKAIADTLDAQSGAVTDNTREYVANRLAQEGAYDAAKKVGFSQKELVDAVLEGGDAYEQINEKLGDYNNSLGGMFDATTGKGMSSIRGMRSEMEESEGTWEDVAAATDVATEATDDNAVALAELQGVVEDAGTDIEELAGIIRGFGSTTLSTRDAARQFQSAIDGVTTSVQTQRDAYLEANGTLDGFSASLDNGTAEGRENEAALDAIATSALELSAATLEQTGSQEKASEAIAGGRGELIKALEQFGITGQAAENYADELGLIPADVGTAATLTTPTAQLDSYITKLNGIPRAFYTTTYLNTVETGTAGKGLGVLKRAEGGPIFGPGGPRDDLVPVWGSNGEHMLDARDVQLMGGQAGVYQFREELNMFGRIPRLANGGAVSAPLARYASGSRAGGFGSSAVPQVHVNFTGDSAALAKLIGYQIEVNGQLVERSRNAVSLMGVEV